MFRRLQNNIRLANSMDAYAQVSDIAQQIQELVEKGSSLIEREEKAIRNEMIETPAIRSLKNQIDSDLYDIYQMAKALEKKSILIQKYMKG
jgi:hypothetical protein